MQEGLKSSLVISQPGSKKSTDKPPREIQYKQVSNISDVVGELSDEQKQAEFHKQHDEYMKMKMERKQELIRLKKEQFGTSSSEEGDSSQESIEEIKGMKKGKESKSSRGKLEVKAETSTEQSTYSVILQLKKTTLETELQLYEVEFQVNKKTWSYAKINKLNLSKSTLSGRNMLKLRIGVVGDEDIVISLNEKHEKGKISQIFMRMFRIKIDVKTLKNKMEQSRCNLGEFGELAKSALIYDKIYKKSQYFSKWQERYIIIKPEGLESFPSLKDKPTMWIPLIQITQLQTQFEWYKQTLMVKLFYNGTKTDFGLPIDSKTQWISRFVGLLE